MFDRVRDWIARALTPLALLALAALLNPLSEDSGTLRCMYAHATRGLERLGPIDTRFEDDMHQLVNRIGWSLQMTHDHFRYVACFLVALAIAYLVVAREVLAVRVLIFVGAILGGFASAFVFMSLC